MKVGQFEGPGVEQLSIGDNGKLDVQSVCSHAVVERLLFKSQEVDLGVGGGLSLLQYKHRSYEVKMGSVPYIAAN